MSYRPQLLALTEPFPSDYIKDDGRGNSYVPHHIVNQRLIQVFGLPPKIELLREVYDDGKLTGVVMRLTVPGFEPVEEGGEADNPQSKTNGARLKDACSDAIKRCAMRLGCGLHLWSEGTYFLHESIKNSETAADAGAPSPPAQTASVPAVVSDQSQKPESAVVGEVAVPPASDWTVLIETYGASNVLQVAQAKAKEANEAPPFTKKALGDLSSAVLEAVSTELAQRERVAS
jgi:hypothetical protein